MSNPSKDDSIILRYVWSLRKPEAICGLYHVLPRDEWTFEMVQGVFNGYPFISITKDELRSLRDALNIELEE